MTEAPRPYSPLQAAARVRDFLIIMIRHKLPLLYALLDWGNRAYGELFFRGFKRSLARSAWEGKRPGEAVRVLGEGDIPELLAMLRAASEPSRTLFQPHEIGESTFRGLLRAPYYLAVGYFIEGGLSGYAFLRLYFPRKAFAGYFVADSQQGKGIGKHLFNVLREIVGGTSFDLYTYNKEENLASIRVSSGYAIEQRMPGGYLVLKHEVPRTR